MPLLSCALEWGAQASVAASIMAQSAQRRAGAVAGQESRVVKARFIESSPKANTYAEHSFCTACVVSLGSCSVTNESKRNLRMERAASCFTKN